MNTWKQNTVFSIVAIIVLALVFTACGNGNRKSDDPNEPKNQTATIILSDDPGDSELSATDKESYYHYQQEVTVISKTPKGAYDPNNDPNEFYGAGWYLIGLSRNGQEPPEYLWRANNDASGYIIISADIGDRGIISLHRWAKEEKMKLPRPNAENPPVIGQIGEVYWVKLR